MAPKWQEKLRKKLGEDMKAASKKAGLGDTAVRDVIERRPDPKLSTIEALARAHEFSIDELLDLPVRRRIPPESSIPVRGHVAAGVWLETDAVRPWEQTLAEIPVASDPRFPKGSIYGLVVRGPSINRVAREGEVLICVDIGMAEIEVRDGDLVILERLRVQEGLRELTAKRLRRRASGIVELWPESDDPQWQAPIILDSQFPAEEVRAIARVEWIWKATA
jgi:SOS-response transcriptional repressor LexA